ncbi:hypothetical protein AGLY_016843 [Aphis glycines]|uniref:Uncharacterized protein n=1 Tax=Aphis glycines TaxID=307491 RepID=A0A6G0SXQ0_APHGL|nr:hypothetical protein AGLY_016843 [Aphis glycines]
MHDFDEFLSKFELQMLIKKNCVHTRNFVYNFQIFEEKFIENLVPNFQNLIIKEKNVTIFQPQNYLQIFAKQLIRNLVLNFQDFLVSQKFFIQNEKFDFDVNWFCVKNPVFPSFFLGVFSIHFKNIETYISGEKPKNLTNDDMFNFLLGEGVMKPLIEFILPTLPSQTNDKTVGHPKKNFESCTERIKKQKISNVVKSFTTPELTYALTSKLQKSGKRICKQKKWASGYRSAVH